MSSSRLRTEGVSTNSVDRISKDDVHTLFRQFKQNISAVSEDYVVLDLGDIDSLSKPGLVHRLGFLTTRGKRFFGCLGARHFRVVTMLGDKDSVIDVR